MAHLERRVKFFSSLGIKSLLGFVGARMQMKRRKLFFLLPLARASITGEYFQFGGGGENESRLDGDIYERARFERNLR